MYPVSMCALLLYYNKSLLLVVRLLKTKKTNPQRAHPVSPQWGRMDAG